MFGSYRNWYALHWAVDQEYMRRVISLNVIIFELII